MVWASIMKKILSITIAVAILSAVSNVRIFHSEPVALILFGICLIGMAKVGRTQFKNNNSKFSWQTFMLLLENAFFNRQEKAK